MVQGEADRHTEEPSEVEVVKQGITSVDLVGGMAGVQETVAHHLQEHCALDHVYEGAVNDAYWKDYCFQIPQIYAFQLIPETEEAVAVVARFSEPSPHSPPRAQSAQSPPPPVAA